MNTLYTDMALRNTGQYQVDTPLYIGITNISEPTVHVLNADGLTWEGIPYFDYSELVTGGSLEPGEVSGLRTLAFYDPTEAQFTFDLVVVGQLNQAPQFTTVPDIEALAGRPYRYDADATDPDGDTLTFSRLAGPTDAAVDENTGEITWSPQGDDVGSHAIALRVEDGRGGSAEQHYVLAVVDPPPNRPPFFTSVPIVDAQVNQPYVYDAEAIDVDDDPLSYSLVSGPKA